jgi:predicted transposase/invertase (TIGR01784 family)
MITEQIGKSEKYEDIKQVISIVITEKEFIHNSPPYHHRFTMYDSINGVELTDIVEVHTLELCKIKDEDDSDRLNYWMRFIKAEGEIELKAVAERDPLIKKAVARLMELSADESARMLYDLREKERMDIEDMLDDVRNKERMDREDREEQARKDKALEIARNLIEMNIAIEQIIKATGLTREEIEKLRDADK